MGISLRRTNNGIQIVIFLSWSRILVVVGFGLDGAVGTNLCGYGGVDDCIDRGIEASTG